MATSSDSKDKQDDATGSTDTTQPVHLDLAIPMLREIVRDGEESGQGRKKRKNGAYPEVPSPHGILSCDSGEEDPGEETQGCHGTVDGED